MDITNYTTPGKAFLKADEVKALPKEGFVIVGEGELVTNKFNDERLHIPGEFFKEPRIFDCSKSNAKIIKEALGTDTKEWIGNILYMETYKVKTSDNQLVDAINVKEAKRIQREVGFNSTSKEEIVE